MQVKDIAKMIDHSLLHPSLTDAQLREGCELAKHYDTASVCIKPYGVPLGKEILQDSDVKLGTVIGFPHGNSPEKIKVMETEWVCQAGAQEVDMVVNIGKVLSEDWKNVSHEIHEVLTVCHSHGAILKVIFENGFLPEDRFKIRLCEICTELGVDFVKTSTGYAFVQNPDKTYTAKGTMDHDLILMRTHCGPNVQVKAAGGIRTLDDVLRVKALGVTRVGATATSAILEEAKKRFET